MKYTILLIATLLTSSIGFSQQAELPDAMINQEVIGGDVLLLRMSTYLIITGKESQALENELGAKAKAKFTREIVMDKSAVELARLYNPASDRKTVSLILHRYAQLILELNSKNTLN